MVFEVGEKIVHTRHGVGEVISVGKEKFFDQKARRYYEVETPRLTVWVPVEGDEPDDTSVRKLTPHSELPRYRELLMSPPDKLPTNYRNRSGKISDWLKDGTFESLCRVVRDLSALNREKPLNGTDDAALNKARRNLIAEWAAAAGMTLDQAEQQIDRLLEASQTNAAGRQKEQSQQASAAYAD